MGQSLSLYPQLVLAVGQLAVDQVAQCVVGVAVVEHVTTKVVESCVSDDLYVD